MKWIYENSAKRGKIEFKLSKKEFTTFPVFKILQLESFSRNGRFLEERGMMPYRFGK